jgi:(hydroxyamino)benzene mutase
MPPESRRHHLFSAGILLFLLALVIGMVMPILPNVRAGLSTHLVALLGGLYLIALGCIWNEKSLPPRWETITFWLAIFGFYENFLSNVLASVFATNRLTPLAGPGHPTDAWKENIVTFGLLSGAVLMVSCAVLVLWGLKRYAADRNG